MHDREHSLNGKIRERGVSSGGVLRRQLRVACDVDVRSREVRRDAVIDGMAAGVRGGGDIAVALAFRLKAAYGAVAVEAAELEVVRDIAHDAGVQLHDSGGVGPLFLNCRSCDKSTWVL